MKVRIHTPRKVSLNPLECGDFFVKEYDGGKLSHVYQKITPPQCFGSSDEIKNQVGTRFLQQFYDDEYVIAHNQTTMENIIIYINKSLAFSVDAVSDDTLVEVLNE